MVRSAPAGELVPLKHALTARRDRGEATAGEESVKRAIRRRAIRAVKLGGRYLVDQAEFDADLEALRCSAPGCERLALGESGRCARHKPGPPPIELEADELMAHQAGREFGPSPEALREGYYAGKLRGRESTRRVGPRRGGESSPILVFKRGELQEDLAACPCVYAGCRKPAPSRSGRCGEHGAAGEPRVEVACASCGRRLHRYVSQLSKSGDSYCDPQCWRDRQGLVVGDQLRARNPVAAAAAREHHARVSAVIENSGLLGLSQVAAASATSRTTTWERSREGFMPVELGHFGGSPRLVFPTDAPNLFARNWLGREVADEVAERRRRYLGARRWRKQQEALGRQVTIETVERWERRLNFFTGRRGGRPRSIAIAAHHLDWAELTQEIIDNESAHGREVSRWAACRQVALEDEAEGRLDRWPDYLPSQNLRAATNRVHTAIKPLLDAHRRMGAPGI